MQAPDEQKRRQRSLAIAGLIVLFCAIVYAVTIFKLGGNVANRPL
jgi:high-affinity Fe2+/Pb2+ permease